MVEDMKIISKNEGVSFLGDVYQKLSQSENDV